MCPHCIKSFPTCEDRGFHMAQIHSKKTLIWKNINGSSKQRRGQHVDHKKVFKISKDIYYAFVRGMLDPITQKTFERKKQMSSTAEQKERRLFNLSD